MKKLTRFLLLLVLALPAGLSAQTTAKYQMLDAKDPLIGEWEWIRSDTDGIAAPFPDQEWQFFKFAAGTNQSMAALSFDDDKGFGCPSYFIAFSNGETLIGTLSASCTAADKGKKFSFTYNYDATTDHLIVYVRGEDYHYQRKR